MAGKKILVTGGAGFVGSNVCMALAKKHPEHDVVAFDNFYRKGSELNMPRLRQAGVQVIRGDVRDSSAVLDISDVGLIIDCAAEPSVMAGLHGSDLSPKDVIDINLGGTVNCLELARRDGAKILFLSTSRVYPVEPLNSLSYEDAGARFEQLDTAPGISPRGVTEAFPLAGPRSLYGATKLCSELLAQEYADMFGVPMVINRCGVIAGPWQFGKTDQGVIALWLFKHLYKIGNLSYIGFGGEGKQVRDILHVDDLVDALLWQLDNFERCAGKIFQLGGGYANSVSLRELTGLCEEATGTSLHIASDSQTRKGDIKWYITDHSYFSDFSGWYPKRDLKKVLEDTLQWARENEGLIRPIVSA